MTRTLSVILISSIPLAAQTNGERIVIVNAKEVVARPGKESVVRLEVHVKEGYHIQANQTENESVIPTRIDITSDQKFTIGKMIFPATKKFRLEGTEDHLDVYDGIFEVLIHVRTPRRIKKGVYPLNGKLNFQACDDVRCLFPRTAEFRIEASVR